MAVWAVSLCLYGASVLEIGVWPRMGCVLEVRWYRIDMRLLIPEQHIAFRGKRRGTHSYALSLAV